MTVSSLGIGSGLDLNGILDGFMQIEATQQTKLKNKVTANASKVSQYQALNAKFLSMKTTAEALNLGSLWKLNKATSSDASVVATASSSAISGNISFKVNNLATSHVMASSGTVSSLDTIVGSGRSTIGAFGNTGIASATASPDLAVGKHTIEVTQASAAAIKTGSAIPPSTTVGLTTQNINVSVNGVAVDFSMAQGTYTRSELVDEINTKAAGAFTATLNGDNTISFSTPNGGSANSIEFTGGNGLSRLGVTQGPPTFGTDGIVKVDGIVNTITDDSVPTVLNSTTGSITASFAAGGVDVGTGSLEIYDYGDGKLSTIVNNINSLGGSMTAAAVQVAPGQYKLQLSAKDTGAANALTIDPNLFNSNGLGTLQTVTAAADATLQVGTGPGSYSITSASNTITDALPGVTLALKSADPTKTVSIQVAGDADGLADKVAALITAANDAMKHIKDNSKYDPTSKTAGSLLGNSTASRLQRSLFSEALNPVVDATLNTVNAVGIKSDASGNLTFDKEAFKVAYAKDPEAVAKMFVEGGTSGISTTTKPGIAERLATLAKSVTNSVDGQLTTVINGVNKTTEDLNKQISAWDTRLAQRRATLTRQFTALDVAIAGFRSQQTWLTGQIEGLKANR